MRMPSASSCASPPSARSSLTQRRDAVGLVAADVPDPVEGARGVRERGERDERRGQLARRRQVEVDAGDAAACRDGERAAASDGTRAHQRQDLGEHRAGLRRVGRPAGDRHRTAGDHRRRQERRGVGEVGLDRDVLRRARARQERPTRRARVARRGRRGAPSDSIVMSMCGMLGSRSPRWMRCRPTSKRGAASSRPETNWLDALASTTTSPPRTCPWPRTMKGSAQCPPSSMSTPTSRSALIIVPIGRCRALSWAVRVTSPRANPASPRHEPHHRARLTAVDVGRALERPHRRDDEVVAVLAGARARARCRRRACAARRSSARSRRSAAAPRGGSARRPARRGSARGW